MEKHTILCVDDEQSILSLLKRLLRKVDCEILLAGNGAEALEHFKENKISLIISDYMMPGMTGVELLQKVKQISPPTLRILITAFADVNVSESAVNKGEVFRYFLKPWDNKELIDAVREALDKYENADGCCGD